MKKQIQKFKLLIENEVQKQLDNEGINYYTEKYNQNLKLIKNKDILIKTLVCIYVDGLKKTKKDEITTNVSNLIFNIMIDELLEYNNDNDLDEVDIAFGILQAYSEYSEIIIRF